MKKFLLLLSLAACTACNDDDEDTIRYAASNGAIADGYFTGSGMQFLGTSTAVDKEKGLSFTDEEARFEFAGGSTGLMLYMHKTRFAAAMPALEMRIGMLPYTPGEGASLSYALESVVPEVLLPNSADGGYAYQPLPAYALTDVEGGIDDTLCRLRFACNVPKLGVYEVTYEGRLLDE